MVLYAFGPVSQLDTVQLGSEHGAECMYADHQLEKYRTFMRCFEDVALQEAASREFLHQVVSEF